MIAGIVAINLYKLLKQGDLDSIKIKDLRLMEIKLNKKIDDLNIEIKSIGERTEYNFQKAKETKTQSEELTLANRIKTLSQKKQLKQNAVIQLEKELRGVINLAKPSAGHKEAGAGPRGLRIHDR